MIFVFSIWSCRSMVVLPSSAYYWRLERGSIEVLFVHNVEPWKVPVQRSNWHQAKQSGRLSSAFSWFRTSYCLKLLAS